MNACFLHPNTPATESIVVPCAPGGKIHLCTGCIQDPDITSKVWAKYSQSHGKEIKVFKAGSNPAN